MRLSVSIFLLVFLLACTGDSPYPGFSKKKHGIYYKLHAIGEDDNKPEYGDYVTADILYQTMADSVFFSGRRKIKLQEPVFKGAIEECFRMMAEGDSATFIISADDFFEKTLESQCPRFLPEQSKMKVSMKLIELQSEENYQNEKDAFLKWIEDFGEYEKEILRQYINEEKITDKPTTSGLYYIKIEEGNGKKVMRGDTITFDLEGRFLNGQYFDSTKERNMPFEFVYGTEWQVIKGLEEGLGMMKQGERAIFILPSELAFGKSGSSTGIVPPFTSLIYEVEMINVR